MEVLNSQRPAADSGMSDLENKPKVSRQPEKFTENKCDTKMIFNLLDMHLT